MFESDWATFRLIKSKKKEELSLRNFILFYFCNKINENMNA